MSHVSRMMNMRLAAMKRNMEEYFQMTSEMVQHEVTGVLTDTGARNICAPIYTFNMFDVSGMWASDYKVLAGY